MKKIEILAVLVSFLGVQHSMAATSRNSGSDSCGLGWAVTSQKTLLGTSTRGTTNGFLPPTFSITSGTSGCEAHSIAENDQVGIAYAATNLENLTIEMAQGSGESLSGLARVMGCDESAIPQFSGMVQKNYEAITGSENLSGADLYYNVRKQMNQDPLLQTSCGGIV